MQKLYSSALLYTFLSFLQGFIGLLLQPLYTHYFSSSDYAVFSLLNNLGSILGVMATLSLGNTVFTFYYDYVGKPLEIERFLGQIVGCILLTSAFSLLLLLLIGNNLFGILFKDTAFRFYPDGIAAFLIGVFGNIMVPYMAVLRNEKNIRAFAVLSIATVVLGLGFQWIAIAGMGAGVSGALIGRSLGNAIVILYVLYRMRYVLSFRLKKNYLYAPLSYAIFLLLNNILEWTSAYSDRFFIEQWFDTHLLGNYSLLSTLIAIIEMGYWAVTMAIQPFLFDYLKAAQNKYIPDLYNFYLSVVVLIVAGVVFLITQLEYFISNTTYLTIKPYSFLYGLAYIFSALSNLFLLHFHYEKNSRINFYRTLIMLCCSLALNAYLIPLYGLWAAIFAALIARLITMLALLYWKPQLMQYFNAKLYFLLIGAVVLLMVCHITYQQNLYSANLLGYMQLIGMLLLVITVNIDKLRYIIQQKKEAWNNK